MSNLQSDAKFPNTLPLMTCVMNFTNDMYIKFWNNDA